MTNMGEVFHNCTTDAAKEETQASRVQKLLSQHVEEILQLKARVKVLEHDLRWQTRALDGSQIGRKRDADRVEALEKALQLIAEHPVDDSKQWEVGCKEMKRVARAALGEKKDD